MVTLKTVFTCLFVALLCADAKFVPIQHELVVAMSRNPAVFKQRICSEILKINKFSSNFNETIAHAIHSLNVQGLKIFNPAATKENTVPTVNLNLRPGNPKTLPYAPEDPLPTDFYTFTMQAIDKILTEIGSSRDGLGPNWSPVERIAHYFHMRDLWMRIHEVYATEVLRSPPNQSVCACLLDTDENGIRAAVDWVARHYESGTPITLLNRPIPKLVDAKAWAVWKNRLLHYYTPNALRDAANYLYCATKKF